MTFAAPELLLALLLVPVALAIYLAAARRRSRYAVRFTNVDLLADLVPRRPAWRRHVPPVLYLAAIAALGLALARPSMTIAVPRDDATIVLAVDVSGSMRATDVAPTRLVAAQKAAADFIDQLPARFRVGLVVFSTEPRVLVTPTTDRAAITEALARLRADGGTAMGDAIEAAVEAGATAPPESVPSASPSPSPSPSADPSASPGAASDEPPLVATVLLSDGSNSAGKLEPVDAAEQAARVGVPVYTIALGTDHGSVEVQDEFGRPQTLEVPPDRDTLAAVAEITGARFFEAPTADDLAQIYEHLGSRVGFTEEQQEVTVLFAGAGLVLVVAGASLAAFWFNRFP
jgi:Ca-activated chloride channel family protein